MSNRQIVIELVSKLPEDTPLEDIAREIEFLAGIRTAREQARRREGIPAHEARIALDMAALEKAHLGACDRDTTEGVESPYPSEEPCSIENFITKSPWLGEEMTRAVFGRQHSQI